VCSRTDSWLRGVAVMSLVMVALSVQAAPLRQPPSTANEHRFEQAEIVRAMEVVKADPKVAPERTIKTLRWKGATERRRAGPPWWLAWIVGLFTWLDQSGRILIWCTAAALAALLVMYVVRLVRRFEAPRRDSVFVAPTHVGDLDIRPERLPADIGAAARALWDCGEHRGALALLYRGLLSRLAHVHGVPIRDSSTEGECLSLAATHLTDLRREYTAHVVRVWQRAVYGREEIPAGSVYVLCDEFAAALDPAPASAAGIRGSA
jgi:Domain of unknown function (DUF4129)